MNNAIISGDLLTDPQLRHTNNENKVCDFTLEVVGRREEDPAFPLKVVAWGTLAEEISETYKKGHSVIVVGRVSIDDWERPEGFKEKRAEFIVTQIQASVPEISLNIVNLAGRMGGDPEVRYFESGSVVSKGSLAVDRPTKAKETDWFPLEVWGKSAETMANWVKKGSLIGVTGFLKWDRWQDKSSGVDRSKPIIKVENLRLLGRSDTPREQEGDAGFETKREPVKSSEPVKAKSKPKATATANSKPPKYSEPAADIDYDDIPF